MDAACNQAAVQFQGRRYSAMEPLDQLLLNKRVRFVLTAGRPQVALSTQSAAEIISRHIGCDTYVDDTDDERVWHVTCNGCDWDQVVQGAPGDDHARHVAEMLEAASA